MSDVRGHLVNRWVRIPEEDQGAIRRYRGSGGPLPRTRRPRAVLAFADDGTVVRQVPGPTDARIARPGRWTSAGNSRIVIDWADAGGAETIVEVVTCDEQILDLNVLVGTLD